MTGQVRSVVVRLSAETAQAIRNVQAFGKAAGDAVNKVGDNKKALQGLDQIGNTAGKVGLLAAAGLGAAVLSSAKFDTAMSAVQAATRETASGMGELRQAALDAGADTVFSATEAAQGIEELAKAGVSTADIMAGGLTGALDLAAAGSLGVGEAAEFTATALNQFSLSGDQASHVADLLAAGAGKAQGEVRDMALALDYAGVPAAQLGVSIEETAGTIALLATNGVIGEKAGTSLRGMIASLTSPSKVAAKEMEALGLSVFDAQGKFIGFEGVAGQLQGRMSELTDQERANSLGRIFGTEQLQAANVLYREGADGVREMTAAVDDNGFAAENASIKLDNLAGDFERLKGALETALIKTGSGSQGPLRALTQDVTGVVDAYNAAPPAIQGVTTKLLAVTAVVGGAAWFGSKVIRGVNSTREALDGLGISASTTATRLTKVAKTSVGILAVGTAVGIIADNVGRIDVENLDRSVTALGRFEVTDEIDGVIESLASLTSAWNSVDLGEVVTAGGLFGDTTLDKQAQNVDALDQKLASLVETGEEAVAKDTFGKIVQLAEASGVSADEAADAFDAYGLAVRNLEGRLPGVTGVLDQASGGLLRTTNESNLAGEATGTAADGFDEMGGAAGRSKLEIEKMEKALQDQRDAAADTARQFFNLGDSLDDSKVSLREWIRDMEDQENALRNFRRNAEEAADKGLRKGLIAALQEAGPAGALRMRQLANASEAEIGRANKAWAGGQRQIDAYVAATVKVPKEKGTNVKLTGVEAAMTSANALENRLNNITDEEVVVRVVRQGSGFGPDAGADGMTVRGERQPYGDKELILAAPGEEVVSNRNGQADRFRPLLKAISANRLAGGGTVGPYAMATSLTQRLADGGAVEKNKKPKRGAGEVGVPETEKQWEKWTRIQEKLLAAAERQKEAADKTYDAAKAAEETYREQRDAFAASVGGSFNNDLYGNGLAGVLLQAEADTNDSASFQAALTQAVAAGLDGSAFESLAQSGDLTTATQLAAGGTSAVDMFEAALANRTTAQNSLGGFAQQQAFPVAVLNGLELATRNSANASAQLEREITGIAERIEKAAERGTAKGAGNRDADKDRDVKQRTRAGK